MSLDLPDISQHPDELVAKPGRGVTRILAEAGMMADFQVAEDILERGSEVHRYTAEMDLAVSDPLRRKPDLRGFPKEWRGFTRAWQKFKDQSLSTIHLVEEEVSDKLYGIRGRLDRVVEIRGRKERAILEIVTGSVQPYKALQMAGYGRCLDHRAIFIRLWVELHEDATFKMGEFPLREYFDDVATFLSCLRVMQWKRSHL
jgi:hypothetical protein